MTENAPQDDRIEEAQEQLDQGDTAAAEAIYRQILEDDPENAEAWNKLGVCLARQGDMEAAKQCFDEALDIDPKHVAALSNRGNIYFDQGDYDAAVDLYQRAIALDPNYHIAHNNLAAAYKKQGKFGEFVSTMKKAQRLQISGPPDTPSGSDSGGMPPRRRGCLGMVGMIFLLALILIWAAVA